MDLVGVLASLEASAVKAQVALQRCGRVASVEETTSWETICQLIVPTYSKVALAAASRLVQGDLEALTSQNLQAIEALRATRMDLVDQVLSGEDFGQLERRRYALERRLDEARTTLKALRAQPGMLDRVEEARRGKVLRPDVIERVAQHETLTKDVAALEAELVRVGGITARHRRASMQLDELEGQIRAAEHEALPGARRATAERLMRLSATQLQGLMGDARIVGWLPVVRGLKAKRALCTHLSAELQPTLQRLDLLRERARTGGTLARMSIEALMVEAAPPIREHLERVATTVDLVDAFNAYGSVAVDGTDASWWEMMGYVAPAPAIDSVELATVATPLVPAPVVPAPVSVAEGALALADLHDELFAEETSEHDLFAPSSTGVFTAHGPQVQAPAPQKDLFGKGVRVGRYLVEGLIGRGGMAEVYLAWQEGHAGFRKRVVLKRMSDDLRGHKDLALMFSREAQIAGQLAHPNLVQVFDYHAVDEEVFIVMEYLDGLPLQRLATRRRSAGQPLTERVALRLIADAARGLHAAHTLTDHDGNHIGLVHRDISPDNLFLTTAGFTKVLDFGIAKRDDLTTLTGKNELKGKIPYMAPEHIHSEALDHRADLFSLGATLYWLLSGQRPFSGHNEVSTLHAVLTKAPPPLSEHGVVIAAGVQELVDAMLEKRRDARPANAFEVAMRCVALGAADHDEAARSLD